MELPRKVTSGALVAMVVLTVALAMVVLTVVAPVTATDPVATEVMELVAWVMALALDLEGPRAVLPSPPELLCVATSHLLALASVILTAQPRVIAVSTMRNIVVC